MQNTSITSTASSSPQLTDNTQQHRFELSMDGRMAAVIEYRMAGGGVIDLTHTEVQPQYEGQGLASKIAKFALDDARRRGLKVIPTCSYVASYVKKHPEDQDLVEPQSN